MHLSIFISVINQLDAQNLFHNTFYFMPLHVSSTCAHHQEVKIALHSLWYHHNYRCDDTRGCIMQFWPPDDEHMCSKHVVEWNKLIAKQKLCASSLLITGISPYKCRGRHLLWNSPMSLVFSPITSFAFENDNSSPETWVHGDLRQIMWSQIISINMFV